MQTLKERFKKWRGEHYNKEKKCIKSAILISDYVNSVASLDTIQRDFANHPSAKYKELNQYKKVLFGILVYSKLHIEECLETLPGDSKESLVLTDLRNIFESAYYDYTQNVTQNIAAGIDLGNKLLDLYPEHAINKKQAKAFCFYLYTLLTIINGFLNKMSWYIEAFVRRIIDLDDTKQKIANLLHKTEQKVKELELVSAEANAPSVVYKTAQEFFNHQYLTHLHVDGKSEEEQLIQLQASMDNVIHDVSSLITERMQQAEIKSKIKAVQTIVKTVKLNDAQITGQRYLLDIIKSHSASLSVLLENTSGIKKTAFINNLNQLQTPSSYQKISTNLVYAMSWGSALITVPYRYLTPQIIQDAVSTKLPITLESLSKASLIDLAEECLATLNQELQKSNQRIETLQSKLVHKDESLIPLIANESIDQLNTLLQANREAKDAVLKYRTLSQSIKEKTLFLKQIRQHSKTLDEFIQKHDGFFVALSNFFAKLFSIFKTETAELIDNSRAIKKDLEQFESLYQRTITQETEVIDKDLRINKEIKDKLKQEFNAEINQSSQDIKHYTPSKQDVRLMISKLKMLFAADTQETEKNAQIQIIEEITAIAKAGECFETSLFPTGCF